MDNVKWLAAVAVAVVVLGAAWSVRSCATTEGNPAADGPVEETPTTLPAGVVVGNYTAVGVLEASLLGEAVEVRVPGAPARTVTLDEERRAQLAGAVRTVADALAASPVGDGADCQAGELRSLTATVDGTSVVIPPVGGVGVCAGVWEALGGVQLFLTTLPEATDA